MQPSFQLPNTLRFNLARLRERLWLKPLLSCILSLAAVFIAGQADDRALTAHLPDISPESLETILSIMSASMLVIAMFAVGAMLSAYASASSSASPRAFPLVISDDVSQNALSTFIGAFIFSIVGLVAQLNGFYASAGRLVLFVITLCVFAVVVLAFVRWVDRIARLGRLGHIINKVETAADSAMQDWAQRPSMGAGNAFASTGGQEIFTDSVGYVQNIDLAKLQKLAEQFACRIDICAPSGTFVTPDSPLVCVSEDAERASGECACTDDIIAAFVIGRERTFESDPRFGLIVMSEIASRALSPAVNDPGTANDIIGSLIRLLVRWSRTRRNNSSPAREYDRIAMPDLDIRDAIADAFDPIARDGAACFEVAIRLQKAYLALSRLPDPAINEACMVHSELALRYAEHSLLLDEDSAKLRSISKQIRANAN